MQKRKIIQWFLLWIVVIVIVFGYNYPILGFFVPIVMLLAILFSIFEGRFFCGNFCPRGAFFDRIFDKISLNKKFILTYTQSKWFRWIIFVLLMGFMGFRLSQDIGNIYHWGKTFWLMCVITTALGIVLAILFGRRTWCSFCPIGTLTGSLKESKKGIVIDKEKCIKCKLCEKKCPLDLIDIDNLKVNNKDCLKCLECVYVCPKKAIEYK